jgi:hypothetical protein
MFGLCGLLPTGIGVLISFFGPDQTIESFNYYSISRDALDGSLTAIFFWLFAVYIPSRKDKES